MTSAASDKPPARDHHAIPINQSPPVSPLAASKSWVAAAADKVKECAAKYGNYAYLKQKAMGTIKARLFPLSIPEDIKKEIAAHKKLIGLRRGLKAGFTSDLRELTQKLDRLKATQNLKPTSERQKEIDRLESNKDEKQRQLETVTKLLSDAEEELRHIGKKINVDIIPSQVIGAVSPLANLAAPGVSVALGFLNVGGGALIRKHEANELIDKTSNERYVQTEKEKAKCKTWIATACFVSSVAFTFLVWNPVKQAVRQYWNG